MTSAGFQQIGTIGDEYNALASIIQNLLSGGVHTATLCQVLAVTNAGGVAPTGKVDLQPLVNQSGADGVYVPQGIIKSVPYFRLYGGSNAVIIDPQVEDIGLAIFCERDISSVIANQAQSNPGSGRQYNISDGLYINAFLRGGTPAQYLQFNPDGVSITSLKKITFTDGGGSTIVMNGDGTGTMTFPGGLTVDANMQVNGSIQSTGDMVANGISLDNHVHTGVTPGGSNTGGPTG